MLRLRSSVAVRSPRDGAVGPSDRDGRGGRKERRKQGRRDAGGGPRRAAGSGAGGVGPGLEVDRRRAGLLAGSGGLAVGLGLLGPGRAQGALVQFPVTELYNTYLLVRAGEGVREAAGVVYTNPVAKTSMDSGLSEEGKRQVVKGAAPTLRQLFGPDESPWLWPSINQRAYQTAEILAYLFQVGRSRIVPEYSFLDARGLGAFEGRSLTEAEEAIAAGDQLDPTWKMPPTTDGTPNESVNDILVRVRQLMSVIETQFSGETVVIIAPDSDNLSILQAAALGTDLRQHRSYGFKPGEARQLQLGTVQRDDSPMSFRCERPPACD